MEKGTTESVKVSSFRLAFETPVKNVYDFDVLLKIDSVCQGNSLFPQATGQVYSLECGYMGLTAISSSSSPFLSAAAGPSVLLSRISCSQVQPYCREDQTMPICPAHQAPFTVALKISPKLLHVVCSCKVWPCHVGPNGLQSIITVQTLLAPVGPTAARIKVCCILFTFAMFPGGILNVLLLVCWVNKEAV